MSKQQIKNLSVLALATLVPQPIVYGIYAIFWPDAFHHLMTRMLPLTIASLLFLVTANLLSYCDVKDEINKLQNYILNLVVLSCPVTSFVIHSNITTLDGSKIFYEYSSAAFNVAFALLLAEICRRIYMRHEKKYEEQLLAEDAENSDKG